MSKIELLTTEEIKDKVAQHFGYIDFKGILLNESTEITQRAINETIQLARENVLDYAANMTKTNSIESPSMITRMESMINEKFISDIKKQLS